MRQYYKIIIFFSLMLLAAADVSAQEIAIDGRVDVIPVDAFTAYLEDPAGTLDISDVRTPGDGEFVAADGEPLYFGLTRSVYWIKFNLNWQSDAADKDWILEIGPPKHVEGIARGGTHLFVFDDAGQLQIDAALGTLESEQELPTLQGGFAVRLDPLTADQIYIRVESARELRLPLTLWNESAYLARELEANTGLGIRYGILIAMIFYNLFLYISIRERSFLFYVISIATQLGFLFLDSKHARLIFDSGEATYWLINMFERNIYILMAMAHLQFQRHLLQVWEYYPALDRVFKLLLGLFGAALLVSLIPDEKIVQSLYVPLIIFALALVLYTNIDAIKRGMDTAILHLAATGAIIAGAGILLLHQVFGLFTNSWLIEQAFELGMIAQALLLSFSLAFRYNAMKKEKEEAQRLAISHLIHSEKIKDQLLANVSHELRTPVHGINGLADIALRDLDNAAPRLDEARDNLRLISSSGNRLIRLIDDLLDVASLRNKGTSINLSAVDLHQLVESVVATTSVLAGNRPVVVHGMLEPDLPAVIADRDRLQQVLINLVSNSIKFTPKGDIWISASLSDPGFITVSVKDNGIGIPSEDQRRIFQPFEKGTAASAIQTGGTGLGLTISAHLVELHGSKLEVVSFPDAGSVFSFRLPMAREPVTDNNQVLAANANLLRRADFSSDEPGIVLPQASADAVILVVDDDAINRRVITGQLEHYQVIQASDGAEALAIVARQKPDLILLDLMMPGLNGYEVCLELRKLYDPTELPVIIVTAKNHLEDLTQGFQAGANDYLSKPFHMEELRARVNSQLRLAELQRVNAENIQLRMQIQNYIEASQELSAAQHHLERILDNLNMGAMMLSNPGVVCHVNPSASSILGAELQYLQGRSLRQLLPDTHDNTRLLQIIDRWEQGEIAGGDSRLRIEFSIPETGRAVETELLLSADEETVILFFDAARTGDVHAPGALDERALTLILNEAQRDVRSLNTRLKLLTPTELNIHPEIIDRFRSMHEIVNFLDESLPRDSDHFNYREQLVTLMQVTLETWEQATGKTKIDLAEGSKLWAVSIDDGRLRTRTFDRYLRVDLLPKVPRWREVVRTAYFVLSNPGISAEQRQRLDAELQKTKAVLQQSALI